MVTVDMHVSWNSSRLRAVRAMAYRSASHIGRAFVLPNSFSLFSPPKSTSGDSSGRTSRASQIARLLSPDCVTACSPSDCSGLGPSARRMAAQSSAVACRTSVQGTVADCRPAQERRLAMTWASVAGRYSPLNHRRRTLAAAAGQASRKRRVLVRVVCSPRRMARPFGLPMSS